MPSAARHPRREHAPGEAVRVAQHEVAAGAPDEQQDRREGGGEGRLGRVVSFWQNFGKFSANFRSFSAVSKRNFARKYAFDSIFQALQDLHTFAPLQSQNLSKKKNRFEQSAIFVKAQQHFCKCCKI